MVVLVTSQVGLYLASTLNQQSVDQSASIFVQISSKEMSYSGSSSNISNGNMQYFSAANGGGDLSPTSITFIVLGTIGFVLLISAMWVIFYIIQRSRSIEERQRLEVKLIFFCCFFNHLKFCFYLFDFRFLATNSNIDKTSHIKDEAFATIETFADLRWSNEIKLMSK